MRTARLYSRRADGIKSFNMKPVNHRKRHIVLHYHFFKNAGTTIELILKQNFRGRLVRFDEQDYNSAIRNEALLAFLKERSEIVAVTSHHIRPPKPGSAEFVFHDLLFVRHPIARLWSSYEFYRRMDEGSDPLATAAKQTDAPNFFRCLISDYPSHACNAQVNLIANGGNKVPQDADLKRALELSLRADILGTAELFDESSVAAEQALRSVFPQIDFSYVAQNVSRGRVRSLDIQLARIEECCGNSLFGDLMDANRLDLELHKAASDEVQRRFDLVPKATKSLARLRAKCRERSRGAATIILASNHAHNFAFHATSCSI